MSMIKMFKKKKSPSEMVASTIRNMNILKDTNADLKDPKIADKHHKALQKVSMNLALMKYTLYGDSAENEPVASQQDALADHLFKSNLLLHLIEYMARLEFEARKDVAQVWNYVLRQKKEKANAYVKERPQIIKILVEGYDDIPEIALNCGAILRPVVRLPELNKILLHNEKLFTKFFGYVQLQTFDVASDAFATFKLMLTKHKKDCADFLNTYFDEVFTHFNELLQSKNYVTKRQSLKLLGELLMYRSNFQVMMKYINLPGNLRIMMNLLRGNTKAIQFEAFHVFKIIVANPKKSQPILDILGRNRLKLIDFLTKFQKDKDDEQFIEEKNTLLETLRNLEPPAEPPSEAPAEPSPAAEQS